MEGKRELETDFRRWFRDQLIARGLTQAQAAWLLGVHPNTVLRWCSYHPGLPSYEQLVRLVHAFSDLPNAIRPPRFVGPQRTGEDEDR
jgi:predicted transcriptional regulator